MKRGVMKSIFMIRVRRDSSFNAAYLAGTNETRSDEVDLYDSGATRHMSGFYHRFINFTDIEPVPITAVDKRKFQATRKGDMYVYIPNGSQPNSHILLKDVLYAPSMGEHWSPSAGLLVPDPQSCSWEMSARSMPETKRLLGK